MEPNRFGRYQIEKEISEEPMRRVYRAYDPESERAVVIKSVRTENLSAANRDDYLSHFRGEAQAAAGLAHPNMAGILDVGEDYLVTELVEGQTLDAIVKAGPLELARALDILRPLADAIDHAHQAGLVHRDIKPGKIMVSADGRPKLIDLGVARLVPAALSTPGFVGSPSYLAPEQVLNGEVTPASDLFSFAVVAYEAMTGHRPFKGDTIATIVHRLVHEDPPSPRSWNRSLPRAFEAIFAHALAKDPTRRFDSALAFVSALEQATLDAAAAETENAVEPALATHAPQEPLTAAPDPGAMRPAGPRPSGVDTLPPARPRARGLWLPWLIAGAALVAALLAVFWPLKARMAAARPLQVGTGELRIEAEPQGATVWIDGVPAGTAPLTLKALKPGPHRLRVLEDGYAPAELGFEIDDGMRPPPLRFVMAPIGSPLKLEALPEGATVLVDGRAVEGALERLVLSPGAHEVRVEAEGFQPHVERVAAQAGQPLAIVARLEPMPPPPSPRPRRAPPPRPTPPPPSTLAAAAPPTPPPLTRGALVALDETVTPPRRLSGEPARYPDEARKLKLKGSVLVELTVSEDGEPQDVRVLESAGTILDRAVLAAVERWRFSPALKEGQQVRVRWKVKQTFMPAS